MLKSRIQTEFGPDDIVREAMGDLAIEFPIALEFVSEEGRALCWHLMSVMLVEGGSMIACNADAYDLRFGIRERAVGNTFIVGDMDFSRQRAADCIPKNEREQVLELVCKAARILVSEVHGMPIAMTTYDHELPVRPSKNTKPWQRN